VTCETPFVPTTFTGSKVLLGGRGPSRVPLYGGDKGEWSDVRLRRGKAPEQVDDRRDRLRQDQRHGGSRRHGQSRVRSRHSSVWEDYDSEDSRDFCEPILSNDGRVIMQYSRKAGMDGATRHSRRRSQAGRSDSRRRNQSRDGFPAVNGFRGNQPRHNLFTDRRMKFIAAESGPDTRMKYHNR